MSAEPVQLVLSLGDKVLSIRCLGRGGTCGAVLDMPVGTVLAELTRGLPAIGLMPLLTMPGWHWRLSDKRAELACPQCSLLPESRS